MAAVLGFEPRNTESESGVLPLHYTAISDVFRFYHNSSQMSRSFSHIFPAEATNIHSLLSCIKLHAPAPAGLGRAALKSRELIKHSAEKLYVMALIKNDAV